MDSLAFIINPLAGGKSSKKKLLFVEHFAKKNNIGCYYTGYKGHAREITAGLKTKYSNIAVFGGDGTINEVASMLIDSTTNLGIIPAGSGNGLAHHLGIPIRVEHAIAYLRRSPRPIDIIKCNNEVIVNVGGMGFDGRIAKLFNKSRFRGNLVYAKLIITQLLLFKEQYYEAIINDDKISGKAFMLAFANGSEFGNRFKIDPMANSSDREFSLVVVRKPPFHKLIPLLIDGFKGKLRESKYYKRYSLKELTISSPDADLHRDGEVEADSQIEELKLKILPAAINVIH